MTHFEYQDQVDHEKFFHVRTKVNFGLSNEMGFSYGTAGFNLKSMVLGPKWLNWVIQRYKSGRSCTCLKLDGSKWLKVNSPKDLNCMVFWHQSSFRSDLNCLYEKKKILSKKKRNWDIGIFKNRFLVEMTQFAKFNKYNLIN